MSGIVITLDSDAAESSVRSALAGERNLVAGECHGRHLAVALESETLRDGERTFERLRELPNVLAVNLAFLDFSDAELSPDEGSD